MWKEMEILVFSVWQRYSFSVWKWISLEYSISIGDIQWRSRSLNLNFSCGLTFIDKGVVILHFKIHLFLILLISGTQFIWSYIIGSFNLYIIGLIITPLLLGFGKFFWILNQIELHLVQNRKENCHHDHIPFNLKGNGNIVFSVNISSLHWTFMQPGIKLHYKVTFSVVFISVLNIVVKFVYFVLNKADSSLPIGQNSFIFEH